MVLKVNGIPIPDGNDGQYIEDIGDDGDEENIIVETNGGNYNERIEGNVVQGRVFICGGRQSGKSESLRNQAKENLESGATVRVVSINPNPKNSKTEPDTDPGSRRRHSRTDRIIIMGGGNYNARIEGNYIQGDIVE